ncbi:MAG: hypothetical protein D6800_05410 [Candidatus Zixiibacteriota bacterium]|nr:MAG: hypothetical protein D6800_05410 [candidate division Zixibacteria bacterium]
MERVTIYCEGPVVTADAIKALMPAATMTKPQSLKRAVEDFEREFISAALARNNGNMTETARELGIERSHLYKKLRKYEKQPGGKTEGTPKSGK